MVNYDNITRLYNIFATLCEYIIRGNSKNYLVKFGCISSAEKLRVKDEIEHSTPLKRNENGRFIRVKPEEITKSYVGYIDIFSQNIMFMEDYNCVMGLIQALDGTLAEILKEEVEEFKNDDFTLVLNTNRQNTGIGLLPRCDCVWAGQSRLSYSYRKIDNYLKHFMVMEDRVLYEIHDQHIFLPDDFFKNFDKNNQLKVAATPITANANFSIDCHENSDFKVFQINYEKDKMEEDNELVWTKILEAGLNEAELMVFPEMLGNPETVAYIKNKLIENDSLDEPQAIPAMIVLPSVYENEQNYCAILDRHGKELARQFKQNPFVMNTPNGEHMEDIIGSNTINIFHYDKIGRFAILICKDFLTTRYMERIMRGFMLTMIIVPSFSTGAYNFKTSFDLCAHDYCNVVWINSCAAMIPGKEMNFKEIGYVRKRITRYDDETKALCKMKPCKGLWDGSCKKDCIYYDSFGAV